MYSKLNQDEKDRFKPILQIIAHSLQFLRKIVKLDESYNFLQSDYKSFTSTANQSMEQFTKIDNSKTETLEKQLELMQKECKKLKEKEAALKTQVRELEQELKTSESIPEIKKQKFALEEELDELKERMATLIRENDEYKHQTSSQAAQLKENDKMINNMNQKIMNSIDLETQIDNLKGTNDKLRAEIRQKENEINMQQIEIKNIQEALEEMEEKNSRPVEVRKVARAQENTYAEKYKQAKEELEAVKSQLETLEKYKSQVNELCTANAELLQKFKSMEQDVHKKVEQKSIEYMKSKNLIDSQMINTFLVQYLRHGDDPSIQKQMLIAMSGILNFSEDEKRIIGLKGTDDGSEDPNIGAKFIDFILEDQ